MVYPSRVNVTLAKLNRTCGWQITNVHQRLSHDQANKADARWMPSGPDWTPEREVNAEVAYKTCRQLPFSLWPTTWACDRRAPLICHPPITFFLLMIIEARDPFKAGQFSFSPEALSACIVQWKKKEKY